MSNGKEGDTSAKDKVVRQVQERWRHSKTETTIRTIGLQGAYKGHVGTGKTIWILDDPVDIVCADHGSVAQEGSKGRRDYLLNSCSPKAIRNIRR